jgi:hypothetical protein
MLVRERHAQEVGIDGTEDRLRFPGERGGHAGDYMRRAGLTSLARMVA